jgi:hypothetical protein
MQITFFERQNRHAAGARFLRAGMSATHEREMPMTVGNMFQTASPELSIIMVNTTSPKTLAGLEAFERVSSEPRFGIGMPALFTCSRKNRSPARLPDASRHSRTISQKK